MIKGMNENFPTFKAFWPYYVSEHQNKTNRNLHFLGTTLAIFTLFLSLVTLRFSLLIFMPIAGYGFSWLGHYFFEKNRPATFQYPLWSLMGDFQMFAFMCMGRMDREVKRMGVLRGA